MQGHPRRKGGQSGNRESIAFLDTVIIARIYEMQRQHHLAPHWLTLNKDRALALSPIGKAIAYTRSKMKSGFQIVAGAYSSYVTRAIWKGIRSRFHFGMGIALAMIFGTLGLAITKKFDAHRKLAQWTYPLGLYVSVTGVLIYVI